MSVTQAMEWLIEHAEDPAIDAPLPVPGGKRAVAEEAKPEAVAEISKQDELTDIFKRIRRKREFRPEPRVSRISTLLILYDGTISYIEYVSHKLGCSLCGTILIIN